MTTNIPLSPVRSLKIRRHLVLVLLVVIAMMYSAVASTRSSQPVDRSDVGGEMELSVHWHGDTAAYHVVAAGEQGGTARQVVVAAPAKNANTLVNVGEIKAVVINIAHPNGLSAPRDGVRKNYEEGAAWLHQMSRGALTIKVDVFERDIVGPALSNYCLRNHASAIGRHALDEVLRSLPTLHDTYRLISFVIPIPNELHDEGVVSFESCGVSGLGEMAGKYSWNRARSEGDQRWAPDVHVIAHEWGHNLGLWHSNYLRCSVGGQPVALAARADRAAGACKRHEYGGEWSVMGQAFGPSITAGERRHLGWLRDGEQTSVSEGIVTLGFDGPVSLVWLQNAEGDLFQVEFVKPNGERCKRDYNGYWIYLCDTPTHSGVLVKFVERANSSDTDYVLDTTPQTGLLADAPLKALQSWTDATGSVMVTVLSITDNSATVHLTGIAVAPSAVQVVNVAPRAAIGSVDIAWEAAPSALRVARYEVLIYEGVEQREVQIVTAEGLRNALQIPNAARGSDYWVAVRAINELGIAGTTSALAPVRWDGSKKPGTSNGGGKPCTGKRPSKRCK